VVHEIAALVEKSGKNARQPKQEPEGYKGTVPILELKKNKS
jgi:hypothetical protein